MIVAGADGFLKSQYRKFNISSAAGANSDDFGMMSEMLTRRFERLLKEDPDRTSDAWPDLLLIDGGAGQVGAVAGIMSELGVEDIAMVGVAKGIDRDAGKEEFHRPGERALRPASQRSRALLRAAPARRGAPLGDRRPPRQARQGRSAPRRSTISPGSAPPASAPFSPISAAQRPSPAPASKT